MSAAKTITLNLTAIEAALLWNLVDAQSDAGACEDGNTPVETKTLGSLSGKLLQHHGAFGPSLKRLRKALT